MTEADQILQRLLSSDAKAELLTLFRKNPGLMDNLDGVGRRIGRKGNTLGSEVDDLVNLGILRKKGIGNSEVIFRDEQRDRETERYKS